MFRTITSTTPSHAPECDCAGCGVHMGLHEARWSIGNKFYCSWKHALRASKS